MKKPSLKTYVQDRIKLEHNRKTGEAGTIDIFRGCSGCEMKNAPCYASKGARRVGIDFFQPVRREFDKKLLERQLKNYDIDWVRIGCISDPSLDWNTTAQVAEIVREHNKTPVIITKAFADIRNKDLKRLARAKAQLQISVCGMTPARRLKRRERIATRARTHAIVACWRINSAIWKPGSKAERQQEDLIHFAEDHELPLPIIDTPIRLFRTSPFWKRVDQEKYHRHISPISGKKDNQRTAGLIIPGAYACYSTCAEGPKGNDPVGCPHQCVTR